MATKDGQKTGGRKAGTPNKRSLEVAEKLAEMGVDPIERLALIAAMAEEDAQAVEPDARLPFIQLAKDCYKELAQYVAPKRKAVEHSGTVGISHEQALAALDDQ
jgi:hypothetical protein